MLRRHSEDPAELASWWWSEFHASAEWLRSAAYLGVADVAAGKSALDLTAAMKASDSSDEWTAELLARGRYSGSDDDVLRLCMDDINDGAVEVLSLDSSTPLGKLVEAARKALLRPSRKADGESARGRTRFRGTAGRSLVVEVVTGSEQLGARPGPEADASTWAVRLKQISKLWGDGLVLFQAVALVPAAVDLEAVARQSANADPMLADLLREEAEVRTRRNDTDWWRQRHTACESERDSRRWLFRVLTAAHTQVVIELHTEIDKAIADVAPKHYRALANALQAFQTSSVARTILVQEALRKGQVAYSVRALWLLRLVATDGSAEQIDKKLMDGHSDVLTGKHGDLRPLLRALGSRKTFPLDSLEGTRTSLPAGNRESHVKLGALKAATAKKVLTHPEEWPLEVVDRAIQDASVQLTKLPPLGDLADRSRWFEPQGNF